MAKLTLINDKQNQKTNMYFSKTTSHALLLFLFACAGYSAPGSHCAPSQTTQTTTYTSWRNDSGTFSDRIFKNSFSLWRHISIWSHGARQVHIVTLLPLLVTMIIFHYFWYFCCCCLFVCFVISVLLLRSKRKIYCNFDSCREYYRYWTSYYGLPVAGWNTGNDGKDYYNHEGWEAEFTLILGWRRTAGLGRVYI